MSWWICLESDGVLVETDAHTEGGTYCVGGTRECELSVTFNYGGHFPFRSLHGRLAAETIEPLEKAVARLGTERADDYWAATPGNAGHALSVLLGWARQHPNARWRVS